MKDTACHQKCPKPWKPMREACQQVPDIKNCYDNCADDTACIASCPKFAQGLMQKKLEANSNLVFWKAQRICPRLEKVHACHKSCGPGDFECHHQCPKIFDGEEHRWQQQSHGSAVHRWQPVKRYQANEGFDIEGFEALEMFSSVLPPDRFNGRFVPIEEMINGRPAFVQYPHPDYGVFGKERMIVWFAGHWRYYSYYDDASKAGIVDKCTFMVKSDAKHPVDIPATQQWTVHPSALKYVQASGFHTNRATFPVEIRRAPDDKGCYDKGEYGVWCPKDNDWHCVRNCKDDAKKESVPDEKGCYDKGEYGVWCPKDNGWYCVRNCKDDAKKESMPDEEGCYDKGEYGVWCPKGVDWVCVDNCKMKEISSEAAEVMSSAKFEEWLTGLYHRAITYISDFGKMHLTEFRADLEVHV